MHARLHRWTAMQWSWRSAHSWHKLFLPTIVSNIEFEWITFCFGLCVAKSCFGFQRGAWTSSISSHSSSSGADTMGLFFLQNRQSSTRFSARNHEGNALVRRMPFTLTAWPNEHTKPTHTQHSWQISFARHTVYTLYLMAIGDRMRHSQFLFALLL